MKLRISLFFILVTGLQPLSAHAHISEWLAFLESRLAGRVTALALRDAEPTLIRLTRELEASAGSGPRAFQELSHAAEHRAFWSRLLPFERMAQSAHQLQNPFERITATWILEATRQPLPTRNLFEGLEAQNSLNRLELQRIALEQVLSSLPSESRFRWQVMEKLPHFSQVAADRLARFTTPAGLLNPTALHQDAVAYLLATFNDARWDGALLAEILYHLRNTERVNARQAELLVEIARGARHPDIRISRLANEVLLHAEGLSESTIALREASTQPRTALEALAHEPIARVVQRRQTSANGSYIVEFENGRRAMFKPYASEMAYVGNNLNPWEIQFAREVGAYELVEYWLGNANARASGHSRLFVPPTVETVIAHEGRSYGVGSLQEFQEGFRTAKETAEQYPDTWAALLADSNFRQNLDRMRTIDWILGNYDRWPNSVHTQGNLANLMIRFPGGHLERAEIALIDNGIGQGRMHQFWLRDIPPAASIPADLRRAIQTLDLDQFTRLNRGRFSEIAIQDFCARIRMLRTYL